MVYVLLAMIIFGSTFALNKYVINNGVDPILFAFLRGVIACLLILPFYLKEQNKPRWNRNDWLILLFIGCGAAAMAQVLEYSGTVLTTASNVSLIVSTESAVAILLSVWLLRERMSGYSLIGTIVAFTGLFLILFDDLGSVEFHLGSALVGDLIVFASVFCWALYTVFSKHILQRSTPISALFFVTLFSSLTLGTINLVRGKYMETLEIQNLSWIAILYLGIFGSGLGHIFYYLALRRLSASIVSLMLTLLPVCGIGFSMILLNERLNLIESLGALVIMTGVGYAVYPRERKLPASESVCPETV
ncbi:MAG: DMT family transporter [bacterium]